MMHPAPKRCCSSKGSAAQRDAMSEPHRDGNSRTTTIILLIAMVLAAVVAIGGFIAVYRATFI